MQEFNLADVSSISSPLKNYQYQKMQKLSKMKENYLQADDQEEDGLQMDYLQAEPTDEDKVIHRVSKAERKANREMEVQNQTASFDVASAENSPRLKQH